MSVEHKKTCPACGKEINESNRLLKTVITVNGERSEYERCQECLKAIFEEVWGV